MKTTLETYKERIGNPRSVFGRLSHVFEKADPETVSQGLHWYSSANAFCRDLAIRYGFDPLTVCSVVSCLSPAVSWTQNKIDAETLLKAVSVGETDPAKVPASTYGANVQKALKIAWTQNPEYIGNGLKTVSFALNMAGIHDRSAVTVDRHMVGAAVGSESTLHQSIPLTNRRYFCVSDAVKRIAKKHGILPKQVQAVIWTQYRKDRGLQM